MILNEENETNKIVKTKEINNSFNKTSVLEKIKKIIKKSLRAIEHIHWFRKVHFFF